MLLRLRALLIDLSGTLHVGDLPTPNAAHALDKLREAGIALRFVSNTSKESRSSLLTKLRKMHLDVREEELFTSLSAAAEVVRNRKLNPLYLLSPSAREDFPPASPSPDSVVIGLAPAAFEYKQLNQAFRLLAGEVGSGRKKGEVPLIVTHKARYFGDKDGKLSLGPGPFISALEEAAGVKAEIVGKPEPAFFQLALDSLKALSLSPPEIGMIGDDVHQDVGPAVAALGLRRYLVKSGKYREGDEEKCEAGRPDWCGDDFASAVESILQDA
ncbi:hypothetical protein JCM10908_006123 [Rhodotorula pacifica]|uniref:uncharacterized protein n=1 Tax=Rhodotorula pacifica TaxID=1495444 RepID=UPI00316CAAA5